MTSVQIAGAFVALLGLLIFATGLWQLAAGAGIETMRSLITGAAIIGVGVFLATRDRRYKPLLPSDAGRAPAPPGAPKDPNETVYFSIVEDGREVVLEQIADLLSADPRITAMTGETGSYGGTPDKDDLPEWFELRVRCRRAERDQVIADAERRIIETLGEKALDRVRIDYD